MLIDYAKSSMAYKKKDEFAKSFDDTPLLGRTFKLKIPQRTDSFGSSFSANYDAVKEILSLSILPVASSLKHDEQSYGLKFNYIPIEMSDVISGPIEMENSFGVKREGHLLIGSGIGVGSYGGDRMGSLPIDKIASDKDDTLYNIAEKKIKMAPEQARQILSGLTLEVSGEVRHPTDKDAHIISCEDSIKKATLDYNYEEHWTQCVISAKLKHLSIVSRDGRTLAEWK